MRRYSIRAKPPEKLHRWISQLSADPSFGPEVRTVGVPLQALAIEYGDTRATSGDQALLFQRLDCDRHAGTMRAEHETEELVRERKLFAVDAVVRHEKPTRQA